MQPPRADASRLAELYALTFGIAPPRGPAGERLGRGTGASLEFQDRRVYSVGDDVRHIDWRAYARTDQMLVRLWREEVLPRVEILVDTSRSMAIETRKSQLAVDLVALFANIAREDGAQPVVIALDARPRIVELDALRAQGLEFDGRESPLQTLPAAGGLLRSGAVRIVISDFLFPHDAPDLVRPLAARAGALVLVQVLAQGEHSPHAGSALRLIDCESDEACDLVLDERTVERYRQRLGRLNDALEVETRRAGGRFVTLSADADLAESCRERLARDGVLTPR